MSRPVVQKKGRRKRKRVLILRSQKQNIINFQSLFSFLCQRSQLHQTGLYHVKTQILMTFQTPNHSCKRTRAMWIPEAENVTLGSERDTVYKAKGKEKILRRGYAVYKGSCIRKGHCDFRRGGKCWYASAIVESTAGSYGRNLSDDGEDLQSPSWNKTFWRATLRIWKRVAHK